MKNLILILITLLFIGCVSNAKLSKGNYIVTIPNKRESIWFNSIEQVDSLLVSHGLKVFKLDSIMKSKKPYFDAKISGKYIYVERKK